MEGVNPAFWKQLRKGERERERELPDRPALENNGGGDGDFVESNRSKERP